VSTVCDQETSIQRRTWLKFGLQCHMVYIMSWVAQPVQCPATGWTTGRPRFDLRQKREEFSSSLCVQTGSGVHPASCTMGTGGPFPGLKRGRGVTLTTHPHLVTRPRMSRSYTSSLPKHLRGV